MTTPALATHRLEKTYWNGSIATPVLRGIDLAVPRGQFLAIVGPSGSGKSTLLYQLGLLDRPTSGRIDVLGEDTSQLSDRQLITLRLQSYGFVFQDYAILPELTALENVILPSLMSGQSSAEAKQRGLDALAAVDLSNHTHKLPSQMSGGQQQRVSIARAIARQPAILFADEPTANLDSEHSHDVLDVFLQLHKQGQTIVMVTHELEFAALASRVVELRDGRIVRDDLASPTVSAARRGSHP
jgi:putative ABC transport system ATP-binding protein